MGHAEKDWRDAQPGDNAVDGTAVPPGSGLEEEAVVVEYTVVDNGSGPAGNAAVTAEPGLAYEPVDAEGMTGTAAATAGEHERFAARWQEIQAEFVDDPRRAIQDADALVDDLMQRLNQMLARERAQLDSRVRAGEDISTEDLRQGLQRYRLLVQRLLAA